MIGNTLWEHQTPTAEPLPKLERFEGYVVSHCSQDSFVLKGMDQNSSAWYVLVSCFQKIN